MHLVAFTIEKIQPVHCTEMKLLLLFSEVISVYFENYSKTKILPMGNMKGLNSSSFYIAVP